jgi:hypothetical protein
MLHIYSIIAIICRSFELLSFSVLEVQRRQSDGVTDRQSQTYKLVFLGKRAKKKKIFLKAEEKKIICDDEDI